jgi:CheY-like chemotaxis protein
LTPENSQPERDQGLSGLRIIVADDDERMREFYVVVLSSLGHEVTATASNGYELVDKCLNNGAADLVITDIKMPGLDGIGAAHVITERVAVPFLFVSAYHDEALIREASMSFSYGYLVKPIKKEDLATSIPIAVQRFREH